MSTVRAQANSNVRRDSHPLSHPMPRGFAFACLLDPCLHTTTRHCCAVCRCELFPVRSPLLRESSSVSIPPLTYMLKFSGYPSLRSGLWSWRIQRAVKNELPTVLPQALGQDSAREKDAPWAFIAIVACHLELRKVVSIRTSCTTMPDALIRGDTEPDQPADESIRC